MAADNVHGLYNVALTTSPTALGGITAMSPRISPQFRAEAAGGEVFPRVVNLVSQDFDGEFSTRLIASALGLVGLSGFAINGTGSNTDPLYLYAQKMALGSTRAGATSHRRYECERGLIVPRRLTVGYDEDALLTYGFTLVSTDGTTAPYTITDGVTLPTADADDERFRLGPVSVGGVSLTSLRQVEIDFGVNVQAVRADHSIWSNYVYIASIAPRVTLRGIDPQWLDNTAGSLNTIDQEGIAATHANSSILLRKWAADTLGYVAPATEQHVSLTFAGKGSIADIFTHNIGQEAGETSIEIQTAYDGSNDPFVIDTTAAIT